MDQASTRVTRKLLNAAILAAVFALAGSRAVMACGGSSPQGDKVAPERPSTTQPVARETSSSNVLVVWRVPGSGKGRSCSFSQDDFNTFSKLTIAMPRDKLNALMEQGRGMASGALLDLIRESGVKDSASKGVASAK